MTHAHLSRYAVLLLALAVAAGVATGQDTYSTYSEAYKAGSKLVRSGNLAEARAPLEAAQKLATTDREKVEATRALMTVYRELPDVEPMQKAAEFLMVNSTLAFERSQARQAMLSFVHKRGKMDAVVDGYEARLEKTPDDRVALDALTEAYLQYKKDATRGVEVGEKLAELDKKAKKPADVADQARLGQLYAKAGRPADAAGVYEAIAPLDKMQEAWYLKEAAEAWLKGGEKDKALATAAKAEAVGPDKRSEILTYFWHKALADVYLEAGKPKKAVPHYEKAMASTKIEGHLKECRDKLAKAKADSVD